MQMWSWLNSPCEASVSRSAAGTYNPLGRKEGKIEVKWVKRGKYEICEAKLEPIRRECNTSKTVLTLGSHHNASDGDPGGEVGALHHS